LILVTELLQYKYDNNDRLPGDLSGSWTANPEVIIFIKDNRKSIQYNPTAYRSNQVLLEINGVRYFADGHVEK
jgi:hypothetical protein